MEHSTATDVVQNMDKGTSAPGAGLTTRCSLLAQNDLLSGPVVGLNRRDGAQALKDATRISAQVETSKHKAGSIAELSTNELMDRDLGPQQISDILQIADKVASAINQKKWSAIAVWADEDNRRGQLIDVKISPATYVAELLELNTGLNSLAPGSEAISPAHMKTLGELTFSQLEPAGLDRVRLLGSVYSPKGWLDTSILVDLSNPGKPVLTGDVG